MDGKKIVTRVQGMAEINVSIFGEGSVFTKKKEKKKRKLSVNIPRLWLRSTIFARLYTTPCVDLFITFFTISIHFFYGSIEERSFTRGAVVRCDRSEVNDTASVKKNL